MATAGWKSREMKHVSLRMLVDVHRDYAEVAESRGVDFSALLNWVLVEYRPVVLLLRGRNDAATLHARAVGLPSDPLGDVRETTLRQLQDLIAQLQETAAKLAPPT